MKWTPYASTRTFRSALSVEDCVSRLDEKTLSAVPPSHFMLGGWRALLINRSVVRNVKGTRFRLQRVSIPPSATAVWEIRGTLHAAGRGTWIDCSFAVRPQVWLAIIYWIGLTVAITTFAIYRFVSGGASVSVIVLVTIVITGAVVLLQLLASPPRAVRSSLEPELYAAVQYLFDATEMRS